MGTLQGWFSPFAGRIRKHASRREAAKILAGLTGLTLAAALTFVTVSGSPASAAGATYYVNGSTGSDGNGCASAMAPCATIQAAIDKASSGDTVSVAAGTYVEDLIIDEAITLSGPNALVAAGPGGPGTSLPSRFPEAIVQGSTIAGARVTVDGVEVVGMKFIRPSIASGGTQTADVRALSNSTAHIHTVVRNSIFDLAVGASRGCGSAISATWNRVDLQSSFTLQANSFLNQVWMNSCPGDSVPGYFSRVIYLDSAGPGSEILDNYFSLTSHVFATDNADGLLIEGNYFPTVGDPILLGEVTGTVIRDNVFGDPGASAASLTIGYGIVIASGSGSQGGNQGTLIEGNKFLNVHNSALGAYYHIISYGGPVADLVIRGNTFAKGGNWAIGLAWNSGVTSDTLIENNDFQVDQLRALRLCRATGTIFQYNRVASPGSSGAGSLQSKPILNGNPISSPQAFPCGTSGNYELTARFNNWGENTSPIYNDDLAATPSPWSYTIDPKISTFGLDPARSGDPGWWPATWAYSLDAVASPTTIPVAGPTGGNATLEIQAATAGATITVSEPDKNDLPVGATPFSLSGAALVDIEVSAGVAGPFTVCLDGNRATEDLWHYEEVSPGVYDWVPISWRIVPTPDPEDDVQELDPDDYPATQICGMTAELTPFAASGEKTTLTVTPDDQTITYGSSAPATNFYTFDVTGFLPGESETNAAAYVAPTCGSSYTPTSPAGTVSITCSGGSADDYEFDTTATADLTVTPATLALTVTGSQTFGTSSATFDATYTPVDDVTVVETGLTCAQLADDEPIPSPSLAVGSYTIKGSSCSGATKTGANSGNYSFSYTGSTYMVTTAATTAVYTGQTYDADMGTTSVLSVSVTAASSACFDSGAEAEATVTPLGGTPLEPVPLTDSTGSGTTRTFSVTQSLGGGIYEIDIHFTPADGCGDSSADLAVLTVVGAGQTANGGGWYRFDKAGLSGSPRLNFGFTIQRTLKPIKGTANSTLTYRGGLLWINNGQWRLAASISTTTIVNSSTMAYVSGDPLPYGTFTCPPAVGTTSDRKCGSFSGTGTLQMWDASADGGAGAWVPSSYGTVTFTVTMYDGGTSKVTVGRKTTTVQNPDSFGIQIDPVPSSAIRESGPLVISGGSIRAA